MDEKGKDQQRLIELGRQKREKSRRDAKNYRKGLRGRNIASTILRLDEGVMSRAKELARLRQQSINAVLASIVEKDMRILDEKLQDYSRGKIDQKTALKDLGVRSFSEFVIALVTRGIPLQTDEREEYERLKAAGEKEKEGEKPSGSPDPQGIRD